MVEQSRIRRQDAYQRRLYQQDHKPNFETSTLSRLSPEEPELAEGF